MILWRFGPKRLSPSLVVWQVRHALLNVCCPDSVSAPLPAGSWDTAGKPRSTRNVVQTNSEIPVRGISALLGQMEIRHSGALEDACPHAKCRRERHCAMWAHTP